MSQMFEAKTSLAESHEYVVTGVGGSSAVTQVIGKGVALTRTGSGAYLLTWPESPGTFMGATYGLQATTLGDIAGHTVIFGAFTAGGTTLAFNVYNASDVVHDLAALEWVTVAVRFAPTSLNAA